MAFLFGLHCGIGDIRPWVDLGYFDIISIETLLVIDV